jgi:hypothetical protein
VVARPAVELIEAAARTGMTEAAASAYDRLEEMTSASDTDWGLGIRARSRALLSEGEAAERLYRESIARLARPGSGARRTSSAQTTRALVTMGSAARIRSPQRQARPT